MSGGRVKLLLICITFLVAKILCRIQQEKHEYSHAYRLLLHYYYYWFPEGMTYFSFWILNCQNSYYSYLLLNFSWLAKPRFVAKFCVLPVQFLKLELHLFYCYYYYYNKIIHLIPVLASLKYPPGVNVVFRVFIFCSNSDSIDLSFFFVWWVRNNFPSHNSFPKNTWWYSRLIFGFHNDCLFSFEVFRKSGSLSNDVLYLSFSWVVWRLITERETGAWWLIVMGWIWATEIEGLAELLIKK